MNKLRIAKQEISNIHIPFVSGTWTFFGEDSSQYSDLILIA